MRIDILTLFPETVNALLHESILGRAAEKAILDLRCVQIRDYTENRQNQVDDYPYGGGFGCVMMAQPLKSCLQAVTEESGQRRRRVIYLSPQGKTFCQETARRLQRDYDHLVLVCGHYEGVDERFIEACVDEEISLGDFVLTGGEIAALAVADAVCRLVPGVLSDPQCYIGESHWDGLLEYPQYTRPENWEGRKVPEILLKGDHEKIAHWRRKQQLLRTREKRPELYASFRPETEEDRKLFQEVEKMAGRLHLTYPLLYLPAEEKDLAEILEIRSDGGKKLKRFRVDEWQGSDPDGTVLLTEIRQGNCFLVRHGEENAAFFTLGKEPDLSRAAIRDGKWTEGMDACFLRYAAVADRYSGSGAADAMIDCAERQCTSFGCRCIRTFTHRKNKAMQRLLREHGFRYRGNVTVDVEPGHDPERQAFEKIIKKRQ